MALVKHLLGQPKLADDLLGLVAGALHGVFLGPLHG